MEQEQNLHFEDVRQIAKRNKTKPALIVRAAIKLGVPVFIPQALEDDPKFREALDQIRGQYAKGANALAQKLTPEQRLKKSKNANKAKQSRRMSAQ